MLTESIPLRLSPALKVAAKTQFGESVPGDVTKGTKIAHPSFIKFHICPLENHVEGPAKSLLT